MRGGVASTPTSVRRVYMHAFSVMSIPDGPTGARRAELVQAIRRGDILLFRAWYDGPYDAQVKSVYQAARAR